MGVSGWCFCLLIACLLLTLTDPHCTYSWFGIGHWKQWFVRGRSVAESFPSHTLSIICCKTQKTQPHPLPHCATLKWCPFAHPMECSKSNEISVKHTCVCTLAGSSLVPRPSSRVVDPLPEESYFFPQERKAWGRG